MLARGRPRLTPEDLEARVADYCSRYRVAPGQEGLPPFPAGKRETTQHREWLLVYKAHQRLARRRRGRCERCDAPAEENRLFCPEHGGHRTPSGPERGSPPPDALPSLLKRQRDHCPICREPLDSRHGVVVHEAASSAVAAIAVHRRCSELLTLAERVGAVALDRVRRHLWPRSALV